jgi:hypothetical protein
MSAAVMPIRTTVSALAGCNNAKEAVIATIASARRGAAVAGLRVADFFSVCIDMTPARFVAKSYATAVPALTSAAIAPCRVAGPAAIVKVVILQLLVRGPSEDSSLVPLPLDLHGRRLRHDDAQRPVFNLQAAAAGCGSVIFIAAGVPPAVNLKSNAAHSKARPLKTIFTIPQGGAGLSPMFELLQQGFDNRAGVI